MISLLHKKDIGPSTLTDTVHKLISLLSDKNVQVKVGKNACVDADHTVYLPPLPVGATEKDFIKYFHLGTHEQAHIFGASNFVRASKNKLKFGLENALEDIRCEEIQEKEYPGLKAYRIQFYVDALEDFLNDEFYWSEPNNLVQFINTLGKYIIVKVRKIQLHAPHINITASRDILKAYDSYVSDLEDKIINMETSNQMFELSDIIYDRLKDLIREEMEKKAQAQKEKSNEKGKCKSGSSKEDSNSHENGEGDGDSSKESEDDSSNDPIVRDSNDPVVSNDDGEESQSGEDPQENSGDQEDNSCPKESDSGADNSCPKNGNDDGIEKVIQDLENSDASMDIVTGITKEINGVNPSMLPYMVSPHVKDIIKHGREVSNNQGTMIRDHGLKLLGPKGSQLTRIFISQTKPRILRDRYKGDLDIISFARDVHDIRDDIYNNKTGAMLDRAAVSIMVDNSSSMDGTLDKVYSLLSGILHTLSKAQIPTEAIGYTAIPCSSSSWRDAPSIITIIKEFKEAHSGKVLNRCVSPEYLGVTNDLDGMKFCIPRLWARPEKKKILMVLCDGMPFLSNAVLTIKLQRAYKEYIDICRKAGVIVFGIGIGEQINLEAFFDKDWVSVGVQNVGETLLNKLTEILNKRRG